MKTIKYIIGLILCGLLVLACSKDVEMGMPGEDGVDGQNGEQGPQGEQGETGTANVIYSDWFSSLFPDDIASTNYSFSVIAPDITDEIVENGLVIGYGRFTSPTSADIRVVEQLPFSFFERNQFYSLSFSTPPATNSERAFISLRSMDGSPIGEPFFEEYRYVIIPGGIPASGKSSVNYNIMGYKEICTYFDIPQ